MTLNQLVCRASSSYPDAYVLQYWDSGIEQPRANQMGGDTLAQFIANELADTYDSDASEEEQVATAVKVMQSAADDLQAVADALSDLVRERQAA